MPSLLSISFLFSLFALGSGFPPLCNKFYINAVSCAVSFSLTSKLEDINMNKLVIFSIVLVFGVVLASCQSIEQEVEQGQCHLFILCYLLNKLDRCVFMNLFNNFTIVNLNCLCDFADAQIVRAKRGVIPDSICGGTWPFSLRQRKCMDYCKGRGYRGGECKNLNCVCQRK